MAERHGFPERQAGANGCVGPEASVADRYALPGCRIGPVNWIIEARRSVGGGEWLGEWQVWPPMPGSDTPRSLAQCQAEVAPSDTRRSGLMYRVRNVQTGEMLAPPATHR